MGQDRLVVDPLSPALMLAMSMHTQPGAYAVLLGSGVSAGAGIPTGWGIVGDLVSRIATLRGESPALVQEVRTNPEPWWDSAFGTPLGYSSLLEQLGSTPVERRALLEPFFEHADDDGRPPAPSAAHKAIARLVRRGTVKVILTTNFDRLMETALRGEGIEPQVVSRADAVAGMARLDLAPVTVIKLHGDYKDVESLNTAEELATYPPEWVSLLVRVFDEYGLLISGWSADWDTALVRALEQAPSRRYPLYWDERSAGGEHPRALLAARQGRVVPASDADELFTELDSNLQALDRLSATPLTTAVTVARLKRYLPDPVRRIDLWDLVNDQLDRVRAEVAARGATFESREPTAIEDAVDGYVSAAEPLLHVLAHGVFHDGGTHDGLWVDTLQSLLDVRTAPRGAFNEVAWGLQHLPARLALDVMCAVATFRGRDDLLIRLCTEPSWLRQPYAGRPDPSCVVLHHDAVLPSRVVPGFQRWNTSKWQYPASHVFRGLVAPILGALVPEQRLLDLLDDTEYRIGLLQQRGPGTISTTTYPDGGEYLRPGYVLRRAQPGWEQRLLERVVLDGPASPWTPILGDDPEKTLAEHRDLLVNDVIRMP